MIVAATEIDAVVAIAVATNSFRPTETLMDQAQEAPTKDALALPSWESNYCSKKMDIDWEKGRRGRDCSWLLVALVAAVVGFVLAAFREDYFLRKMQLLPKVAACVLIFGPLKIIPHLFRSCFGWRYF